jgi:hypothetical protein
MIEEKREPQTFNLKFRRPSIQLGLELTEQSRDFLVRESHSAHSSRSFNGYEQINQY